MQGHKSCMEPVVGRPEWLHFGQDIRALERGRSEVRDACLLYRLPVLTSEAAATTIIACKYRGHLSKKSK